MSRTFTGDMSCPHCRCRQTRVVNTYGNKAGDCISRRRECLRCRRRCTTHERLQDNQLIDKVDFLSDELDRLRDLLRRHAR